MSIKKAIILAASNETNAFPITKSIPKAMLPVLDKPTISYIVEEALESGIEEIAIIVGENQHIIEDYFKDHNNIYLIPQEEFLGTAHALTKSEFFIGNESFALLLGDEITVGNKPCLKQLIEIFNINNVGFVAGVENTGTEKLREYNFVFYENTGNDKVIKINDIIEKPQSNVTSNITSIGRYIITSDIFSIIQELLNNPEKKVNDKFYLTTALSKLAQNKNSLGVFCENERYHISNVNEWLNANVDIFHKKVIKEMIQ